MNSVFMAENQMQMGALIQTFPNNKYIKLVCSPEPDPGPSDQQVEPTGQTKNSEFKVHKHF